MRLTLILDRICRGLLPEPVDIEAMLKVEDCEGGVGDLLRPERREPDCIR